MGGTFTDLVEIGAGGVRIAKTPSTPANPDEGAFAVLLENGTPIESIDDLSHGSTVATNAVLERKGFRIAFVTTAGFRDILLMQRHGRSRIYDLEYRKPEPVVERADSFEVAERILSDGTVLTPLDQAAVERDLIPALTGGGYEGVAVCLLNAYVNPAHEEALREIVRAAAPDLHVTVSSDVTREFREYERASTTTLAAYVQPVIDRYIGRFETRLADKGFAGRFSVMQSNGGRLPADAIRRNAVNALLSGPAAGVMGATRQIGRSGFTNLLTLDMGGTSTDLSAVTDARPHLTQEFTIDGLPIRVPIIDIHTIGAGGGSIVWVDEGGMLCVGPHSAGAQPGPACYMRGGTEPTLTDAHLICQTIRPEAFLGGRMKIDPALSRKAFSSIAGRFGMSLEEAASSAIRLADANITRAIQLISTERGLDPRDYVLVPFGGAGPLHAARVAEELGVDRVVVPPSAGVISAYGLIASDFIQFTSLTRRAPVDAGAADTLRAAFAEMREDALARARAMRLEGDLKLEFTAEMRFVGQAFEVPVPFEPDELDRLTAEDVARRFAEAHQRVYFFGGEATRAVEFVSFRLGVTSPLAELPLLAETEAGPARDEAIELFYNRRWTKGRLVGRAAVAEGQAVRGPALLEDPTATVFVPEGWSASRDANDNTIMQRERGHA